MKDKRDEQTPQEFEIRDRGHNWEVWDTTKGLGIGFRKWDGETSGYLMFIQEGETLTGDDFDDETMRKLVEFARERFPQEFEHLPDDPRI